MVLMIKGNASEYVPDAFIEDYRKNGYVVTGEEVKPLPKEGNDPDNDGKKPDDVTPEDDGKKPDESDPNNGTADDTKVSDKFVCPHCGKEYAKKAYLDKHVAEKHPN